MSAVAVVMALKVPSEECIPESRGASGFDIYEDSSTECVFGKTEFSIANYSGVLPWLLDSDRVFTAE